jgi:hypothetical protein
VGLDVLLEGVADILDLGDVGAEHAHAAAIQRLGRQAERPAAAFQIDPAQGFAAALFALGALSTASTTRASALRSKLLPARASAELEVAPTARMKAVLPQTGWPSAPAIQPARPRCRRRRRSGRRRQAGIIAADGRQAQPGQGARTRGPRPRRRRGRRALRRRRARRARTGPSACGRGRDRPRSARRAPSRPRSRRPAPGRRPARLSPPATRLRAAALDGDHGGVEGVDPAGRVQRVTPSCSWISARLQRGDTGLKATALAQRPQGDANGETNRAGRRREDQVVRSHQARRLPQRVMVRIRIPD